MIEIVDKHASFDTYAKKMFILNTPTSLHNLKRLKAVFGTHFLIIQALRPIDKRYDNFFASILQPENGVPKLPLNIRILSWNFDIQIEKSYFNFCEQFPLLKSEILLNPNILRINGICGLNTEKGFNYIEQSLSTDLFSAMIQAFKFYSEAMAVSLENGGRRIPIYFAWDEKDSDKISKIVADTKIMVIIGYSFPFFNRKIDMDIFKELVGKVARIYIQTTENSFPAVKERIQTMYPTSHFEKIITPIYATDYFHIPDELML